MAIQTTHKEVKFGVGDRVKVWQRIKEGEKIRLQAFEGMVLGIKGRDTGKSFTVRRIGEAKIGIEKIFPLDAPIIEKIEVVKHGMAGSRRAKLYYTRYKARKEIEEIYSRASLRNQSPIAKKKASK